MRVEPSGVISVLIKETHRAPLFLPHEDTTKRHLLEARRRPSPECDHAGTLIMDFSASKTVTNKLLLFNKLLSL